MRRISIAMCTYNGEKYLREQLDSLLSQTHTNIEIIIVDDGSNDLTIQIATEYQRQDSRISVFQNEQNLGFVKNFEKAISLCSGEFIALADQDDVWIPEKIEMLLNSIEDGMLVYSDAELVDAELVPLGKNLLNPAKMNPIEGKNNKAFIFGNCVSGNTMMFRKELVDVALPIPADVPFHDNYFAFYASTCGGIQYVDKALVRYRQHGNNITDSAGLKKKKKRSKLDGKRESNRKRVAILRSFLPCSCLCREDKDMLELLLHGYEKYESTFFNFSIFRLLYRYRDDFFAIETKKSLMKIVKAALGLNAYKIFPFL